LRHNSCYQKQCPEVLGCVKNDVTENGRHENEQRREKDKQGAGQTPLRGGDGQEAERVAS
jgi:hypothetical protein